MRKILSIIDNFEEILITILLPLMCVLVFMATFFRYTQLVAVPWAEELARYILVWIIFLGIGTAAKKNAHFSVQILDEISPSFFKKVLYIVRILVVTAFCLIIVYLAFGILKAQMRMGQTSPALGIPIWMAYLSIPVGCFLMVVRTLQFSINKFKNEWMSKNKEIKEGVS